MNAPSTVTAAPAGPAPTIFAAIVRQVCVDARYNGGKVILAPHAIFTRHGELYIAAITVSRDFKMPREPKIGLFKLDGLADLTLTERAFEISPLFDRRDERFATETLMAVEPAAG
jgi:hypothetical protein